MGQPQLIRQAAYLKEDCNAKNKILEVLAVLTESSNMRVSIKMSAQKYKGVNIKVQKNQFEKKHQIVS